MAFTRNKDDLDKINFDLGKNTSFCNFMLDVPGNGNNPYIFDDPNIRLQKWGGNLDLNSINISSDLKGLTRPYCRDNTDKNEYKANAVKSLGTDKGKLTYVNSVTDESRTLLPAWIFYIYGGTHK